MSPSRGPNTATPAPKITSLEGSSESSTEARATVLSSSALTSLRQNVTYMLAPNSPTAPRPLRLRTRALLRSLHYVSVFVFWRIVRYAKYALVGSLVAAVGATAFGGMISGVGFILAPPTLLTSIGIGTIWAVGKWGFRKAGMGRAVEKGGEIERDNRREAVKRDGEWRDVQGPQAVPW